MKSNSFFSSFLLGAAIVFVAAVLLGLSAWLIAGRSLFRPPAAPAARASPTPPPPSPTATPLPSATFPPAPSPFQPRRSPTAPPTPLTTPPTVTLSPAGITLQPTPRATSSGGTLTEYVTYVVKPGDSLYQIAARFAVDALDLMRANHITNPSLIQPGQVFTIPGPGAVPTERISGPKSIQVDLAHQTLNAYQGNSLVYSFTVSTGFSDGTLHGEFTILDKLPNAFSDTWNVWMPFWLGFYFIGEMENGFHGLPVLPSGITDSSITLGKPSTRGCVVLGSLEAKLLYDWADVGTPVTVR